MILITPRFLKYFAGKFVNAMALWPFILVKNLETKESQVTIHHEKIHIRQQIEMFILPFYIVYLGFYLINRLKGNSHMQAYLRIPFEKEAYCEESNFDYLHNRKFWAWRFYIKD
jgi:hypothetical protein